MSAVQQRAEALALANVARFAIADVRRELRKLSQAGGCDRVVALLDEQESSVESMRVGQLLCAIRWLGPGKAGTLLHRAGVLSPDRRVRELTERQRCAVADGLRRRNWL